MPDSELEPRRHSRGLFSRSKKWFNCDYEVRAHVGPADLTFELWHKGQKLSDDHEPIRVTWDEDGAASAPQERGPVASEASSASVSSAADSVSGVSSAAHSEHR